MTRLFAVYIFYQNKTLYYHQQNCLFPSASRLVLQTCIVLIGYMCVCYVFGEGEGGQVSLLRSQRIGPDGP